MARSNIPYVMTLITSFAFSGLPSHAQTVTAPVAISSNSGVHPNLVGQVGRPLRYHPENGDLVIEDGQEFFNRSLYGGNTTTG